MRLSLEKQHINANAPKIDQFAGPKQVKQSKTSVGIQINMTARLASSLKERQFPKHGHYGGQQRQPTSGLQFKKERMVKADVAIAIKDEEEYEADVEMSERKASVAWNERSASGGTSVVDVGNRSLGIGSPREQDRGKRSTCSVASSMITMTLTNKTFIQV